MAADDDDALFPLPPVEETEAVQKEEPGPVEKSFRPYDPNQVLLLPPVAGGVAAGEAPGPLRERTDGGGTGSERDPRGLHRGARLPTLRPAADGQAADLRILHGPAVVAGHREALLGRRRLPLPGGWGGAGLPIDRALPTPASGGAGRPLPEGTAAMPKGGGGAAGGRGGWRGPNTGGGPPGQRGGAPEGGGGGEKDWGREMAG